MTLDHASPPRCESSPRSRALASLLVLACLLPTAAFAQRERGFQLRVPGVLMIPGAPPRAPSLRAPDENAVAARPSQASAAQTSTSPAREILPHRSTNAVLADIAAEISLPERAGERSGRDERPGLFRSSRLLIASGSVLLTTGVPLALMTRKSCDPTPVFAPTTAAITLAAGGLFTVLGSLALRLAHRRFAPNAMSRRERSRLGGFVILSYLTLAGTLSTLALFETRVCNS